MLDEELVIFIVHCSPVQSIQDHISTPEVNFQLVYACFYTHRLRRARDRLTRIFDEPRARSPSVTVLPSCMISLLDRHLPAPAEVIFKQHSLSGFPIHMYPKILKADTLIWPA